MDAQTYLIFDLDGTRFGLDTAEVLESVWLPELSSVEESPRWITGMFSLRGRIVPVIDLFIRFGHPSRPYRLSDQVVILKTNHMLIGLIVSEVLEVTEIPRDALQPAPEFDAPLQAVRHFVSNVACVGDDLVSLLDMAQLTKLPEMEIQQSITEAPCSGEDLHSNDTVDARALFRARAIALRETAVEDDASRVGLAVLELSGEYFGIELATVQEFCAVAKVTSIPCCPPHILGVISLRGSLLTLIDPRAALNLPPDASAKKAVIAQYGEQLMGVAVDEVHDVIYLRRNEIQEPPEALREQCGPEVIGTAAYLDKTITVLDLPVLMERTEWIVNETV